MERTELSFLKLLPFLSFLVGPRLPAATAAHLPPEAHPTNSGYLTVNPTTGSALFYAFYEAQNPTSPLPHTPLLLWLQGGPGCSSMLGNFFELGPWRASPRRDGVRDVTIDPNPGAWNRIAGLLFVDSPIGTGFSVAASGEEIPRDQKSVASHLFVAIRQFLALDPSFKRRPIYFTGESYAGKYVPAFGYYTVKWNARLPSSERLNLQGVAIGNGLTDPAVQVTTHAANAYFSGLINEKQRSELEAAQLAAVRLSRRGKWSAATDARKSVLGLLQNLTGLATLYDLRRVEPYPTWVVGKLLQSPEVKAALGVNRSMEWEECSAAVGRALQEDVMKSARFMVEAVVREVKVLVYQGQCDLRDGVVSTEAWVKEIRWEGIGEFMAAERRVWTVEGKLAGYVQVGGNLSHAVVLRAGHFMPFDQPQNSQAMIEAWVLDKGLFTVHQPGILPNIKGSLVL